ncbi:PGG domain [Sesbania bispinosa]|nr:PGG domain [Sesbania bispinosa]
MSTHLAGEDRIAAKTGWRKFIGRVGDWFAYKDRGEWLKDMKGGLSLTATIIATMTFQLATNPPGGVLQASSNETTTSITSCLDNNNTLLCPGEAVLGVLYRDYYLAFLECNTICFVASLTVCLLLVSGIDLNHRFPIWFLSILMCITISTLILTYLFAASMVTPNTIWGPAVGVFNLVLKLWAALAGLVGLFLIIRAFIWGVKKCIRIYK